jgi:hypothetical protein
LIQTARTILDPAKLNGLDPQHYLADMLARIADHPAGKSLSCDQRADGCGPAAALVGAGEQVIFATNCDAAQRALGEGRLPLIALWRDD